MGQLQEIESQLVELGYKVAAVSPDQPRKIGEKLEEKDISYLLLSDSQLEGARSFGLVYKLDDKTLAEYDEYGIDLKEASGEDHNMLPVPAVYIIDKKGIIRFSYVNPNYKVRLDPDVLLCAARAAAEN